jgi:stearoyl-CoA desaturase (delta-9 desaturase)
MDTPTPPLVHPADDQAVPPIVEARARSFRRTAYERPPDERVNKAASIPFILIHVLALAGVIAFGITPKAVALCVVLYVVRMWFITAGYHRYFAHRAYKTNRAFQFVLAFGGTSAAQKGPLWWAAHHRNHHRDSDSELDVHSPLRGFWWSHVGWILCDKYNETEFDRIRDFAKYPELRFINKFDWIAPWMLGFAAFFIAGLPGLFTGFFLSTVLLWHNTFMINSVAHVFGRRRYATEDTSRNNALLAVATMGEGWHNNHHYFQASARNGFFWWEIDVTYYVLRSLSWLRIVRDLKTPTEQVLYSNWVKDGSFDIGMFRSNWAKAAAAVANSQPTLGDRVRERRTLAGEALTHRREAVEGAMTARKQAVEGAVTARKQAVEAFVHESLLSAEELARVSRRTQRDLGLSDS